MLAFGGLQLIFMLLELRLCAEVIVGFPLGTSLKYTFDVNFKNSRNTSKSSYGRKADLGLRDRFG